MPSAPSTSWAAKPMSMNGTSAEGSATKDGRMLGAPPCCCVRTAEHSKAYQGSALSILAPTAGIWVRLHLNYGANSEGKSTLAVWPDCLSGFSQITRSRSSFALGRTVLSGRHGARSSPRRALVVGRAPVLPCSASQSFCAVLNRDRHPPGSKDRPALLSRPRFQRDRRERGDR